MHCLIARRGLRVALSAPLLAILLAGGCSRALSTVEGIVRYRGVPLTGGDVVFHPLGGGAPAYGTIHGDGAYSLRTGATPGAAAGEYQVTVVSRAPSAAPSPLAPVPVVRSLIPERYGETKTSGLRRTVAAGKNQCNLDLEE